MGRLMALSLLPKENDLLFWKILQELKKKLSFSNEEIKELNVKMDPQFTTWDRSKDIPKVIEFTDIEVKIITDALKALDSQKKITEEHLPLCMAFGLIE
jgi:hypothetical protein